MKNPMSRLFLIAVISLIVAGCTPQAPAPPATDVNALRDEVGKIRADWTAAAERDDAAAVAQFYTDDAVMMGADGVVARGRQGIQEYFAKAFATSGGLQVTPTAFDASGDLAYDSGRYSQDVTPPGGQPMKVSGHYVVVLKRQADGAWKIVHHIATPEVQPQSI